MVQLSSTRRIWVTVATLTAMLLAAMESTVVSTAMPTVIANLGGLSRYSWVFSIYLLTSTISMPIWGKISDLYGRRNCYLVGISIFLIGSMLSGASQSMNQLIVFRAVQGIGSGAIIPLSMIVIGEIYTFQERARMQGVFSSVWGISSVFGPILGGFITDNFSWRWVFYVNLPIGLLAAIIIVFAMKDLVSSIIAPKIDYAGAISLSIFISLILIICLEGKEINSIVALLFLGLMAVVSLSVFIYVEDKAVEPILPLNLFKNKMFLASSVGNFLAGSILFGVISFIPLFMQVVLNTSATASGKTIMFLLFSWICCSIISGRLIIRHGHKPLIIIGMLALALGTLFLTLTIGITNNKYNIYGSVAIIGAGMGLATFSLLMALQNNAPEKLLGVVTSSTQFFRNIGGVIGTGIFGSIMSVSLAQSINKITETQLLVELKKILDNPNLVLDSSTRNLLNPRAIEYFSSSLAQSLHLVFVVGFFVSLIGFITALFIPKENLQREDPCLVPQEKVNLTH